MADESLGAHLAHMDEEDGDEISSALLAWLNTFVASLDDGAEEASDFAALKDGLLLFRVCALLIPSHFDEASANLRTDASTASNPLLPCISNLRKLVKALGGFFEAAHLFAHESVAQEALESINISAIAREGEAMEMLKLLDLVLLAAVNSENRDVAVQNIMGMAEAHQQRLMFIIRDVMDRYGQHDEVEEEEADVSGVSEGARMGRRGSEVERIEKELVQVQADRDEYRAHSDRLSAEVRELKAELARQEQQMRDSEAQFEQAKEEALAAQREQHASELEVRATESRKERVMAEAEVLDLRSEVKRLTAALDEASGNAERRIAEAEEEKQKLQDKLDVVSEQAKKLRPTEAMLERYKAKLEELGDVRSQVGEYQAQHSSQLKRIASLELEIDEVPRLRNELSDAQKRIRELQREKEDILESTNDVRDEVTVLREIKEALEAEKGELKAQNEALNTQIMLLEAGSRGSATPSGETLSMMDDDSDPVQLQKRISKLEAENEALKARGSTGEGGADAEELERAKAKQEELKQQVREQKRELLRLRHQVEGAGDSTAGNDAALQNKVVVLQAELTKTNEALVQAREAAKTAAEHVDPELVADYHKTKAAARQLQEQNTRMKKVLRKLKQKSDNSGSAISQREEELTHMRVEAKVLKEELAIVREELQEQKRMRQEQKAQARREMQLVSSAFYEIGCEYQVYRYGGLDAAPQGDANGATPHRNSWLNRQRRKHQT